MQTANYNHNGNSHKAQAANSRGRGKVTGSQARYIATIINMIATARRMNNGRVLTALESLLHKRGG